MEPIESGKKNVYHIQVKETRDHLITEWSGSLSFMPQDNGETFIAISFNDLPELSSIQDQPTDAKVPDLSIECIDYEILQFDPN